MSTEKHFAVVEDDDQDLARLTKYLDRYMAEKQQPIRLTVFRDGLDFLESYQPGYDLILMDIEMPHLDGLQTAKKLREMDGQVALIFITQLAQYAIKGYEVSAMDYMVKPISYGTLTDKLDHAFRRMAQHASAEDSVFLNTGSDVFRRIKLADILYIVKDHNYLRYVTKDEEIRVRGTLKDVEARFAGSEIVKCASGCMVNLRHIEQKVRSTVLVAGVQFTITRPYLEEFTQRFMAFLRGGQ